MSALRAALFVARKDLGYMLRQKETLLWTFGMPPVFFFFIGTITGGFGDGVEKPMLDVVAPEPAGWMADALTQRLADEPSSLAFLDLGEALRRRGQLEAAYKVARGGLNRYPGLADAHDLMARILSDQGDFAGAFALAALWLLPMLFLTMTAIRSQGDLISNGVFSIPRTLRLENFTAAWKTAGMGELFTSSFFLAMVKVPLGLLVSSLAAYALAKTGLPGRRPILSISERCSRHICRSGPSL